MEPYQTGLTFYGVKEVAGVNANQTILDFFASVNPGILSDEISWCAAFANYCVMKAGKTGTGKLTARSFLKIGDDVDEPELGDIVVFWRGTPNGWQGHVGFFINKIGPIIYVLGGNQADQVNIQGYNQNRLLGYRRL